MTELFDTLLPYLTPFGMVAGLVLAFFNKANREKDFQSWIQRNSIAERYDALLHHVLLRRTERLYGSRWLSWQAFAFSFQLAYLYLFIAALVAYALKNSSEVAGLSLLPADKEALTRSLIAIALIFAICVMIHIFKNHERVNAWYDTLSERLFGASMIGHLLLTLVWAVILLLSLNHYDNTGLAGIVIAITGHTAVVAAGAFSGVIVGAVALIIALAFGSFTVFAAAYLVCFGISFHNSRNVGITFIIATGFALAVSLYFSGHYSDTQILLLLYILLPLINAAFDCILVKYSRYFVTRMAFGEGTGMVSKYLLLDAILALLFFFGLLLALPPFIDGYNWLCSHIAPLLPPIDWRELALQARHDPWGAGFLVTLMLCSTSIPISLHLLMAGMALGGRGLLLGYFARGMQHSSIYVLGLAIWLGVLAVAIPAACYWLWQALNAWLRLDITGALYNLLMLVYVNGWQYAMLALVSILLVTLMFWRLDDAEQIHAKAQARSAT